MFEKLRCASAGEGFERGGGNQRGAKTVPPHTLNAAKNFKKERTCIKVKQDIAKLGDEKKGRLKQKMEGEGDEEGGMVHPASA